MTERSLNGLNQFIITTIYLGLFSLAEVAVSARLLG